MKQPTLREALDKLAFDAGAWGANPDNEKPSVDQAEQAIKDLLLSKFTKDNYSLDEITKTIKEI